MVPHILIDVVLHAYHDNAMYGGQLALTQIYDKVRDRFVGPNFDMMLSPGMWTVRHVSPERQPEIEQSCL